MRDCFCVIRKRLRGRFAFIFDLFPNLHYPAKITGPTLWFTKDVPILRADHATSQASLSGVRKVDQHRFP